jgi:ketosteroid isomerase-like protein
MNTREREANHPSNCREAFSGLEAEHCRAFVARDLERLEHLWSDDLIVNSPINRVHDKRRVLELLRAGIISHSALECQAEAMMQHGPFVVVMGHELVTDAGSKQYRRRYTNIWRVAEGSWRLVARHANVISD